MKLYPATYRRLLPHWLARVFFFLVGVVLLYAPFALLSRLVLTLSGRPMLADVHTLCLRMPIQWLAQPWMYGTIIGNPSYWFAIAILPVSALFMAPLFCGWMCPAGQMTEFLSRLVPPRFQINLAGKVNPVPVRYGFTLGFMAVSFIGGNACCSFCNFTHAQNLISAVFGDTLGIGYWASFMVVSFGLWFVLMGLFTRGGRGWCNFLCPAGAMMGLFHALGTRIRFARRVRIEQAACTRCETCVSTCPAWAITHPKDKDLVINYHGCSGCMDCARVCPAKAISYGTAVKGA